MTLRASVTLACLTSACATVSRPPESVTGWMARSTMAWTSMKADGAPVPSLDRTFVQAGMGTASSLVFVVLTADQKQPWKLESLESIGAGLVPSTAYTVVERVIGDSVRLEVSGLLPGQQYRARFAIGSAVETVESRTAPEHAETTSVLITSCNEPWNRSTRDGVTVGVPAASASALRTLDLRASGLLPVELGHPDGSIVRSQRSSFLLGLGDQAYVDAEPGESGSLALFAGPRSDEVRVAIDHPAQWAQILARIYRMHFLIPTFHRTLSSLPSAMVWDDHEIRDGWGSQRDEDKRPWPEYFAAARQKAWEFEVARNSNAGGQPISRFDEALDRELDTSFEWGDRLRVFLLDTRTARGAAGPMSGAQLDRVLAWLLPCAQKPSVFLLGVPVPLSINHDNALSEAGTALQSELDDDVADGWWATAPAREMRARLETAIADHASRCALDRVVLVSGDVHESGIVAIAREKKTVAYEIISSGIASMVLNGALSRAFLATRGSYFAQSPSTGLTYSGIGRISTGSSFIEVFFEFPEGAPPRIRALFYPTTEVEPFIDNTLINVGSTLKGTTWQTGTTSVDQIAQGKRVSASAAAIELTFGAEPPSSGESSISNAAMRCTTDLGLFSTGTRIDQPATDWSTLFAVPRECRMVEPPQ